VPDDLVYAAEARWTWCAICQTEVLTTHAPPYVRPTDDETATITYLQDRWDVWGAEVLVLECGASTVWAAVAQTVLMLHKRQPVHNPAAAICATAQRMARARRRRGRDARRGEEA
jgi:hypothetical protein